MVIRGTGVDFDPTFHFDQKLRVGFSDVVMNRMVHKHIFKWQHFAVDRKLQRGLHHLLNRVFHRLQTKGISLILG
ncbi:uncharacterized protein METZ01_LOCUS459767, partial [marine metagenome]